MADSNTPLRRQDLFALVWEKPATHIAKEFGVKVATVLKACSILDVPRPTTGHWSKVEFGKAPKPPLLPAIKPGGLESIILAECASKRVRRPRKVLAQPVAIIAEPTDPEATDWHPAVQKTRFAYRGGGKDYKYGLQVPKIENPHLLVPVTSENFERALRLLNRLAWLLERNGFKFEMPAEAERRKLIKLVYAASGTEVSFSLSEHVERYPRPLKPDEKDQTFVWNKWLYRATGRLRLVISEAYPHGGDKSWGDGKHTKLDDKLPGAVLAFIACAEAKHAEALEWAAQRLRWAEEQRVRDEREALKRKEDERRAVLVKASENWSTAERLRTFRAACEARLRGSTPDGILTTPQAEWLRWVDGVVDDTDPLTAGFLKRLESPVEPPPS